MKKKVNKFIMEAKKYLGYPYVWGGDNPTTSFDCSGYVYWVVNNSKIGVMERVNANEISNKYCIKISLDELKKG